VVLSELYSTRIASFNILVEVVHGAFFETLVSRTPKFWYKVILFLASHRGQGEFATLPVHKSARRHTY
jgi:hypothetical protein